MTTGLVLGKFAPLHKGHQLLIETAIEENDETIVMIYDVPDVTSVPLKVRSRWLKALYPQLSVIEAWDGPTEVGDAPGIKRMHEEYILRMLDGRPVSNFYSSEFYGQHVSEALGAQDRRVDPNRKRFPVSATAIRNDAFAHRQFLSAIVYSDLITKVVFLGAPSTGKTTLARELAKLQQTVWMPEYGREYWDENQRSRQLTLRQLVEIAEGHRSREDVLVCDAHKTMFVDTDATTTFIFSMYYHGKVHPRLMELASETLDRYDLFFLCGGDIPYDDTLDRSGEVHRRLFQAQIKTDLLMRRVPYITLSGTLNERVKRVLGILAGFDKYSSLGDNLSTNGVV